MSPLRTILLHVCCAPCASHCARELSRDWAVTMFFSNSNLFPAGEYEKRLAEVRRLAEITNLPLVEDAYRHERWLNRVRGLEDEPERGRRCLRCFQYNLKRTAAYARLHRFDAFTTTLSVSPHKRSPDIFRIGIAWDRFLPADFKKKDGFKKSLELSRRYRFYRQNYCGCEFSMRPQGSGGDG